MVFLVVAFSVIMALLGLYGMANPAGFISLARKGQGPLGVWFGALTRVVFGVALWSAAPTSHTPTVLEVLAVISLISGIALPLIGVEKLTELISWWSGQSSTVLRGWAAVAIALGLFLVWSTAT